MTPAAASSPSGAPQGVPDGLELPRPPGAVRRFLHSRPWVTDTLVAALYALLAAVFVAIAAVAPTSPPVGLVIALSVAGTVVVLLRRRLPVTMFAASNLLLLVGSAVGTNAEVLLPLLTVYAVSVYRSTRAAWVCFGAGVVVGTVSTVIGTWRLGDPRAFEAPLVGGPAVSGSITAAVFLLVATLIGTNVGARNRYVAALVDRAAQLARERDAQAEIARAFERERIARDMHDVIAHSLAVMIALSEGARATAAEHPDRAQEAMERSAETGRRTLGEVRRMLGTVRDDGSATRAPQPGIDDLGALIADITGTGLPVTLTTRGTPHSDPALELTLYRIVQESLTNTLRHGSGVTRARVNLDWGDEAVTLTIDDDGASPATPAPMVGRGLIGMRERVALFGGELTTGPAPHRGWRVSARIPLDRSTP